jgi:glyoxylase-like metal-dependent hydrolase (beta-lactamase superfamily II)
MVGRIGRQAVAKRPASGYIRAREQSSAGDTTVSFASQGDLTDKATTFTELAPGVYAYTAEGDPNSGVIVGEEGVMVVDATATPVMARTLLEQIRKVTDQPVRHVLLTHYHAVRVMGASGFDAEEILASEATHELIEERGQEDFESEVNRFPRLFRAVESVPGLTWPSITFETRMTVWLGKRRVEIMHLGRGHTKGDTVAWLPDEKVLFSGDLVEYSATPYTGDAYLTDWPATLERLRALQPAKLVPGRGDALTTPVDVAAGIDGTRDFVTAMFDCVRRGVAEGKSLKEVYDATHAFLKPRFGHWVIFEHCMPFDVARAYDEARGQVDPRIWTKERDVEMWRALQG